MGRRAPIKVKPSPASERPENKADEKLARSSRELQQRMRDKAQLHTDPAPQTAPKTETKPEPSKEAPAASVEAAPKPAPAPKPEQITRPIAEPKVKREVSNDAQRFTIRVPLNLTAQNAIARMAKSFSKDNDYVMKALLKNARADLMQAWEGGKLVDLVSDANLIAEQNDQSATSNHEIKPSFPKALATEARELLDDPLGLRTDNQIIGAFIGAMILAKITKA